MKNKIWLFQIPLVALFTFAFWVTEAGVEGKLDSHFLRTKAFPWIRTLSGMMTNLKFHARGPEAPKNKIVIVEVDSNSIAQIGRWPWHRDVTAYLIDKSFEAGAKVVGLDMVFSERDQRVPDELAQVLQQNKLGHLVKEFETDYMMEKVIAKHSDRLVLGWTTENSCQPVYDTAEECPVNDKDLLAAFPEGYEKFAYTFFNSNKGYLEERSPFLTLFGMIPNIEIFNAAAQHAGYFNAFLDADGYVRRSNLLLMAKGRPYPSLPLEMARVALKEELQITLGDDQRVKSLGFAKSGRTIPVSPLGAMEINFRGPSFTFEYVPAIDVMRDGDEVNVTRGRTIATASKRDLLKDAYVLIGVSALGVFDMRAFPFDSNTPGVEGHANILDNILSNDMMTRGASQHASVWMFLLMSVGALLFAYLTDRLESVPALLMFLFVMSGLTALDLKVLFDNNINWNTSLLYIQLSTIFVLTMAAKYVMEERNKKFIKGAFAKYVAPAIIDSIMKDPTKLTVGGEKKDLTILFSDIRSFTTFSEKMDAKQLAGFLNDYLGIMTDIVFDNEGTLDKYIGDAVMAFWGAPLDQAKHASNACKAAIKMLQALSEHQPRFKQQYGIDVNVGIGINSGPVNVGNMGSDRIFEYTVIGDHVNLASRLEGLTKTYGAGIVTTRFTFDMIQGCGEPLPGHRVLDFVKVKGKKKAVELIQVLEREYSADGLKLFEEARQLYNKQQWDQAIEKFTQANEVLKPAPDQMDGPCEMYLERCKEFKINPPAADWDGSWVMTSK